MKAKIKKVTVLLAFMQLFSAQIASANEIVFTIDQNSGKLAYKRYDPKTMEYNDISIFDEENIESHQYGANQIALYENFDNLIKDPLILKEVLKYFPKSELVDYIGDEDTYDFYRSYFYVITCSGCGYAAGTNLTFRLFEGREDEFKETFGFPMYKVTGKDKIDFNYELFMLKFFNYSVIDRGNKKDTVRDLAIKHMYKSKLDKMKQDDKDNRKATVKDFLHWSKEEYDEWKKEEEKVTEQINNYQEKYDDAKDIDESLGMHINAKFGHLWDYLKSYGINVKGKLVQYAKKFNKDTIIASEGSKMYEIDQNGNFIGETETGSHFVYVTDINGDKVLVSSWGSKYELDPKSSSWISTIEQRKSQK